VLMDLFSSITATSQSRGFMNTDRSVRSGDEELDPAFSRQNSAFHSTPQHCSQSTGQYQCFA
jgi:hypothetical protein